jgi:hypothetical protein
MIVDEMRIGAGNGQADTFEISFYCATAFSLFMYNTHLYYNATSSPLA